MELAEDELKNFIKVWTMVFGSLCYIYILSGATKRGFLRLLSVLPVVFLFFLLPLNLTSIHFTGLTSFFISWLATFKLLLFAFGLGPLCSSESNHSISFPRFIAIACFPIKLQHSGINNPPTGSEITSSRRNKPDPSLHHQIGSKSSTNNSPIINYILKVILVILIIKIYDFSDRIHPYIIWLIYFLHMYLQLELTLDVVANTAKCLLGLELEPQFNQPFLSTSLQDFWGRRWNLMVSSILRPTVYEPILLCCLNSRVMDRRSAQLPAVLATFLVSGIMHELIFYYMGRMTPDLVVTAFFLLHGICLCAEILLKRSSLGSKWRIPRVVSGPLTVVFVVGTGFWLFLPPMLRFGADVRSFREYAALGLFLRKLGPSFI